MARPGKAEFKGDPLGRAVARWPTSNLLILGRWRFGRGSVVNGEEQE